ncbi:hypothetical protein GCM10009757_10170 [Streptomyces cheonanensis]|uniref:Uncharacterized protein n=1 Tax=Streptomyces cheonanensis TaxID=312720 RepID=A0ABN2UXP7_9ACTN
MGDIYRKLSFGSLVLPNAPKCNRRLIPIAVTRDTAGGCMFPAEWHSPRYPPEQDIGGHLPEDYWSVDLLVSW